MTNDNSMWLKIELDTSQVPKAKSEVKSAAKEMGDSFEQHFGRSKAAIAALVAEIRARRDAIKSLSKEINASESEVNKALAASIRLRREQAAEERKLQAEVRKSAQEQARLHAQNEKAVEKSIQQSQKLQSLTAAMNRQTARAAGAPPIQPPGGAGGGGGIGNFLNGGAAGGAFGGLTLLQIGAAINILKEVWNEALKVVSAIASVGVAMFNAAAGAAEYGSEIYKAHQKTRFASESLSTLKLISNETGVSFDQIVRAIARFEANIGKSLTKPSTEAALALKAMHFEGDKLKSLALKPEEGFFNIVKQLEAMENVTKRDRIALALFGRDFQSLIPIVEQAGSKFEAATARAKRLGVYFSDAEAERLFNFQMKLRDVGTAAEGMGFAFGKAAMPEFNRALDLVLNTMVRLRPIMEGLGTVMNYVIKINVEGWSNILATLMSVPTALRRIKAEAMSGNLTSPQGIGGLLAAAYARYRQNRADITKENLYDATAGVEADESSQFPTAPKRQQLSEYEKLVKRLKELRAEIASFLNTSSREFGLRFQVEDAERFKRDLEQIVSLRRELSLPLTDALPQNGKAAKELMEQLQSYKRVRDAVNQTEHEGQKTAEELAAAILSQNIPVIAAETRYQAEYVKSLRARRDEEQKMTADLMLLAKQRQDALSDEAGELRRVYTLLRTDVLKQNLDATRDEMKAQLRRALLEGREGSFVDELNNKLSLRGEAPSELKNIEGLVGKILDALTKGKVTNPAGSDSPQDFGTGTGAGGYFSGGLRRAVSFVRGLGLQITSTTGGIHNIGSLHKMGRAIDVAPSGMTEDVMAQLEAAGFIVRDERTRPTGQKVWTGSHFHLEFGGRAVGFGGGRSAQNFPVVRRSFNDILSLLNSQGADDVVRTSTSDAIRAGGVEYQTARSAGRASVDNAIADTELRIVRLKAEELKWNEKNNRALFETKSLEEAQLNAARRHQDTMLETKERIVTLQYEIAHAAEGAADRYEVAWLEAIKRVQDKDEEAVKRQIAAQVEIADKAVFHSARARADILEHVAQAKGVTEVFSGAVIQGMDAIGNGFSALFGKVNQKLGAFGQIITNIESSLLSIVTNRLIMRLVDGLLGGGQGGFAHAQVGGFGGGGRLSLGSIIGGSGGNSNFGGIPFLGAFGTSGASGTGVLSSIGGFAGSDASSIITYSSQAQQAGVLHEILRGQSGAGAASIGGSLTSTLRGILPLGGLSLGASLGGLLGGSNRGARLLGTVAGGALGLSAGLAGFLALGGSLGTGTFASVGAAIAGALPIIAPIAGAALIASYIIGKNSQRRKEEQQRNQMMVDAFAQMDNLLAQVRNHRADPIEALTQAATIREQYLQQANQLKDKKTRAHAVADVSRIDARIALLRNSATQVLNDNARFNAIRPSFATGGVVPGQRGEPRLVLAHGGEIVASLAQQTPAFVQAARDAGIPGIADDRSGDSRSSPIQVTLVVGRDAQNEMFVNGAKSDAGFRVLVENKNKARERRAI